MKSTGVRGASIVDLISICYSRSEAQANEGEVMARKLLNRFQKLHALGDASPADLFEMTGLDGFDVLRAQSLVELGRRIGISGKGETKHINGTADAEEVLDYLRVEKREHFVALLLDAKNALLRIATIHIGTLTSSLVGTREVFREAVRDGASAIVVAHNHPSGDPEPSPEDIEVTKHLVQVGNLLDIRVLDHVIIGERKSVSLRARGLIG